DAISLAPPAQRRDRSALDAALRGTRGRGAATPRTRAGAGVPAGPRRRQRASVLEDPGSRRHLHRAHGAAVTASRAAAARGRARDRALEERIVSAAAHQGAVTAAP